MPPFRSRPRLAIFFAAALAATACGFGTYDDSAAPPVTTSNSGVADAGMWWPWACTDGTHPSPQSAVFSYVATGSCGAGGAISLSADGCLILANFDALGLSDVNTDTHSSTPNLGGWVVDGTSSADAATALTCQASVPASANGAITFTCSAGMPPEATCTSTLTPAVAP